MSSLTRSIEKYINGLLEEESEAAVSLRRKELAATFGCVPSQINYVLRSRFTQEQGFIVESQRGGHGYIRIIRIRQEMPEERLDHIEKIIGDAISWTEARKRLAALQKRGVLSARERLLIEVALRHCEELGSSEFDISPYKRDVLQAQLLKRMLRCLVLS